MPKEFIKAIYILQRVHDDVICIELYPSKHFTSYAPTHMAKCLLA